MDDPAKVKMTKREAKRTHVASAIVPMVRAARSEIRIISPYFVPGKEVTAALMAPWARGKQVGILTNSLAANDVAAVHGGYSRYRRPLLEGGVELWELKPMRAVPQSSMFGSSGASLHTKSISTDGRSLFVGSYNVDPRSTWLNCEQGVLVEDDVLAKQLDGIFAAQTAGAHAWKVSLNEATSPGATARRRLIPSRGHQAGEGSRHGWRASCTSTPSFEGTRRSSRIRTPRRPKA